MQPFGGSRLVDQRAVAPDRAVLLADDALPDAAADLDVVAGVDHLSALRHHLFWHRRRGLVDVLADPQHDAEADHQQGSQAPPESPGDLHRSEEHTSEIQSLMRTPYAVFCL